MTEQEFYENIPLWISKEKSEWNHITYLAYFCNKYEKVNGVPFRLVRCKNGPTRGKEASDFAKLFRIFAPENYSNLNSIEKNKIRTEISWKIYNYINWVFDYKFRMKMGSVTGTRLFHIYSLINEFERMYLIHQKKIKDNLKINDLRVWCKNNYPDLLEIHQLNTINDIKMLISYSESYNLSKNEPEMLLIREARRMDLI